MKRLLITLVLGLGICYTAPRAQFINRPPVVQGGGPNLLHSSDFTYVGAFRLPAGNYGSLNDSSTFAAGWVGGVVYNDPINGKSLFIKGDLAAFRVSNQSSMAQIVIPALLDPRVVGTGGLNFGTHVQGFTDASGGKAAIIMTAGGNGLGSSVVYNGKLIGTEWIGYDANCVQSQLAWVGNLTFGSQTGGYTFPGIPHTPRLAGQYLTVIPTAYRAALGGSLISGAMAGSIVSCGPIGPSLFALDGDTLATQPSTSTNITAVPLVYYDISHSNLGAWNSNDPTQNCVLVNGTGTWPNGGGNCTVGGNVPTITFTNAHSPLNTPAINTIPFVDNAAGQTTSSGILFADNTRSVLVFGAKSIGAYHYKPCTQNTFPVTGTDCGSAPCFDSAYAGHPYAYDPDLANCTESGGDFAWPSTEFVWAFDVNDLIAVKNGTKNPYDVVPYTGWSLGVPGDGDGNNLGCGASWDAATRLVYLVCDELDQDRPLVHVYHVGTP